MPRSTSAAVGRNGAGRPVATASKGPLPPARQRIDSIDLLRGIVMVIMMLDHTRDFVYSGGLFFDLTDLNQTTFSVFFTRWITHFCAPVFVFLAGVGAYPQFARGKSKRDLSRFLLIRGLWLIVLELTLVRLGATFSFDYRFFGFLQVIWAIGVSMIILAALIHLPLKAVAIFGVAMIALHNLLDGFQVPRWLGPGTPLPGIGAKLWMILHQQGGYPLAGWPGPFVFVVYPLIPWIGVMAAGYAFGSVYKTDAEERRKILLYLGGLSILLFCLLRALDYYGDPMHWAKQQTAVFTLLSFVDTTKYPPSLLFLLMTLGPALVALAWFERLGKGPISRFFVTFGRVPLFFYLLQWPTAHLISVLLHLVFKKPVAWLFKSPVANFENPPRGIGFNLAVVYACWIAGVLLLYPLCKWFAGVKARRRDWWLSYL
jgi:uncharacterized membrane protein